MKHLAAACGCMIVLLGFAAGARAAPTTMPTQAIGLQVAGISPTLRIDSEDVELSQLAVRAAYVLTSTLTHPRSTTLRVVLPAAPIDSSLPGTIGIDGTDASHGRQAGTRPRDDMDVKLRMNGRLLVPQERGRALLGGRDVTAVLRELGVPRTFASGDHRPLDSLGEAVIRQLIAGGFLVDGRAQWTYQATYEWTVPLPPGSTRIELAYRPIVERWPDVDSPHAPDLTPGGAAAAAYCTDSDLRRRFNLHKPHYGAYVIAHDWRVDTVRPHLIGHVRLRVDAEDPDALVAFCPAIPRMRQGSVSEWTATDFTPTHPAEALLFHRNDTTERLGLSAAEASR